MKETKLSPEKSGHRGGKINLGNLQGKNCQPEMGKSKVQGGRKIINQTLRGGKASKRGESKQKGETVSRRGRKVSRRGGKVTQEGKK